MATPRNNGYAVAGSVQKAMRSVARGFLPGDPEVKVLGRPYTFYHARDYAAAGHSSLRFFNVARTSYVTNLPTQGGIEANTGFLLQSIQCQITTGLDTAGAAVSGGNQVAADDLATLTLADSLRNVIMANAEIRLTIGERQVFNELGLHRFPGGGGAEILSTATTTASTTSASAAVVNNGAPLKWNAMQVAPTPWPVLPGQTIELIVDFPAAITLPVAGVITFYLNGTLFTKATA